MCSHIALWLVVVTDAPRPPVCSSSASCQHLDSAVSRSEMMPTCLWHSCLLFNLCQGGALLFKAPDLFTAPPHRRRVLPLLLVLLVMSRLLFFFSLSHSHIFLMFFMPNSLPPPFPPPLSPCLMVHSHSQFIFLLILVRPHTAVETLSRHDMSWVNNTTRQKGPVVVVFYSLWTMGYRHMAQS